MISNTNQNIRVLMISPQFRPIIGGYERSAERLAGALTKLDVNVHIITERRDATWPVHELVDGVSIQRLPCIYRPHLHMLSSLLVFAWFLLRQGRHFDVWHVHQYGFHAALALALGKLLRRPVILKLTSSADQGLSRTLAQGCCSRLVACLHRQVDGVVALTQETAAEAVAFGIPVERVHVLGNGVNIGTFHPRDEQERIALKHKLGLGAKRVVVFVGRMAEAKNVEGLLKAWSLTSERMRTEWQLVLVGDGPLRHSAEQRSIEYLISDTVKFVGQQKNIEDWMGAAEIYVSTSWHEGLSNTLLEAMATGLPAVVTRVSGVSELVEANVTGITVEIGDMENIAIALSTLAADDNISKKFSESGRQVIENNYSLESVAVRMKKIYRSMLNR